MKKCYICKKQLSDEMFPFSNKNKNIRRGCCIDCWKIENRKYRKQWYNKNKDKAITILCKNKKKRCEEHQNIINDIKNKSGCIICKYNKCSKALDFHHIKDKNFSIGEMNKRGFSIEKILKEIEKCVIVCSNCHREIHENLIDITNFI